MNRGDVVAADFPFQDVPGSKVRPALVVQNDADNRLLANTVLAMITGNLRDSGKATCVFVDPASRDGTGSGLNGPSLIKCGNLSTVRQTRVLRVLGHISTTLMKQVDEALRRALGLP